MIFYPSLRYVFALLFWLSLFEPVFGQTEEQEIKVELRSIGNAFLQGLGDSTSRILPIQKIDGRYAVQFEREFTFEPDLLITSTFAILENSALAIGYLVEVEECEGETVVHSFRAIMEEKDEPIACQRRGLPPACYVFYFTVIEKLQVEQIPVIVDMDNAVDSEDIANNDMMNYVFGIGGLIFVIGAIRYVKGRKKSEILPNDYIQIGQFQYDQKGMKLIFAEETIELSSKESDLLYLLYRNESETLKREDILHQIWGDEGDYVGRTLDVFISKLRKKLEADTSLKIVNIRGVGYRFVISL